MKSSAKGIFIVLVLFLMLFPFINTLNQFLVKVVEPLIFFKGVQDRVIPYQVSIVRVVLEFLQVPITTGDLGANTITLITKRGEYEPIALEWNCLGWQSLLIVIATLITGLSGKFSFLSKLEVLTIGLLGTFLFNIARISSIFFLYYHANRQVALVFHDYGGVILTIFWLALLWYYAFNFVLQPKKRGENNV